jgi:hypothetical protein
MIWVTLLEDMEFSNCKHTLADDAIPEDYDAIRSYRYVVKALTIAANLVASPKMFGGFSDLK